MSIRWQPVETGFFTIGPSRPASLLSSSDTTSALFSRRAGAWTDDELAAALDVLSNPVRLAIARALKEPRCLSEIAIGPSATSREHRVRGSLLARQTVKEHLDRLVGAGIVSTRKVRKTRGELTEYVLNADCFQLLSQAVQELARSFEKPQLPALMPLAMASSA